MIVGAAVCPGAPFLVDGVADAIAGRLSAVSAACRNTLALLPDSDTVLLLTTGAADVAADPALPWRLLAPGTIISSAPVRRSDLASEVPCRLSRGADGPGGGRRGRAGPSPMVSNPAVGTIVGAHLAASMGNPVTALEMIGEPAAVATALADRARSSERISLLVVADGSACHGDEALGRRDDRAGPFDSAVTDALAAGDPARLRNACADRVLAGRLLATVDPLAVLALLTEDRPPQAAVVMFAGAPLGVWYIAASWRWTESSA